MTTLKHVRRYDYDGQITSVERTPQGFLKVPGYATRTGVFPYIDPSGKVRQELRHPDDVFAPESLITLKNSPVTLEHPPGMVTPENCKQYMKGYTTDRVDVDLDRSIVECDLIIADEDTITAVEKNGLRELSSGYTADIDEEVGEYNGIPYEFRQKNIRYNHIAIVKQGRAGPEVRLRLDSADAVMQPNVNDSDENKLITVRADELMAIRNRFDLMHSQLAKMEEEFMGNSRKDMDINIKGISPQIDVQQGLPDGRNAPPKVNVPNVQPQQKGLAGGSVDQQAIAKSDEDTDGDKDKKKLKQDDDVDAQMGNINPAPSSSDYASQISDMQQMIMAIQAKLDQMANSNMTTPKEAPVVADPSAVKMDSAQFRSIMKNRVKLEKIAEKVLPRQMSARLDSMTDDQIRYAVIQHKHPKADLVGKNSVYIQTRFDSIVEALDEGEEIRSEMGSAFLMSNRMDANEVNPHAARQRMIAESRTQWQSNLSAVKK